MIGPVQQLPASAAPTDLAALYRDPPDGVRVNMITSLDGAAFVYLRYVRSLEGERNHERIE